jgi:hypothetical protein
MNKQQFYEILFIQNAKPSVYENMAIGGLNVNEI